jgi:hypothetical protein
LLCSMLFFVSPWDFPDPDQERYTMEQLLTCARYSIYIKLHNYSYTFKQHMIAQIELRSILQWKKCRSL